MATTIYGASDDLIEFDGEVRGEVCAVGNDASGRGVLVVCDDGTLLEVKYGKGGAGVWSVVLLKRGALFERIDQCDNEDAVLHSDVAHFRAGLKRAWAAKEWELVR